jgi:SAM-dependent methyltransferase
MIRGRLVRRDPTRRFTDRVASYERGRPSYPRAVLDLIAEETGLAGRVEVADVGSGTGIFTRLLLDAGCAVWAIEPDPSMRHAAERALNHHPRFHSVEGRAEATGLPATSVDLVVAAQAFHWFTPEPTGREWRRILRPPGWAALLWNDRTESGDPFQVAYEAFLRTWGDDYAEVRMSWKVDENLVALSDGGGWVERQVPNAQTLDLPGLEARVMSSSYMPAEGSPTFEPMREALRELFHEHERDGRVGLSYQTRIHIGRVGAG